VEYARHFSLCTDLQNEYELLTSPRLLGERSLFVAFSNRRGGVSKSPYDSLNLSWKTGDVSRNVIDNRRRLFEIVGVDQNSVVVSNQVHGDKVLRIGPEHSGVGVTQDSDLEGADALVTDQPGMRLLLLFADCVPVALADLSQKVIAGVHSGRAGCQKKISSRTIGYLDEHFGSKVSNVMAYIGPSIGPCCYEVDEGAAQSFAEVCGEQFVLRGDGRPRLDLWSAVEQELSDCGIPAGNIDNVRTCTCCNSSHYFSHRADGPQTGRQGLMVGVA